MHDIIGVIDDHRAPGSGTFDFRRLKPYIREDLIKVLEIHEPASADDILNGVENLDKVFQGGS